MITGAIIVRCQGTIANDVPRAPPDVSEYDAEQRRQRHADKAQDDKKASNRLHDGFVRVGLALARLFHEGPSPLESATDRHVGSGCHNFGAAHGDETG